MDTYAYAKINITAQFSLDAVRIWGLLLIHPGVHDHNHTNALNQIDVLMYA